MFSSRGVRTVSLILVVGILLVACAAKLQAWQDQTAGQEGNLETLALSSATTPTPLSTEVSAEDMATHTPFPIPWPVNAEGTPFDPFELTPILTIPAVNAEGTPLTPTPSAKDMLTMTPVAIPTSTPLIVANSVDLAVGLPDEEVWLIAVLRTDGYIDEYRIPAAQVLPIENVADVERYRAFRDTIFQLQPGEIILDERLLTTPTRKGIPVSPEDLTAQIETPLPPTDVANVPSQSSESIPFHLPQIEN